MHSETFLVLYRCLIRRFRQLQVEAAALSHSDPLVLPWRSLPVTFSTHPAGFVQIFLPPVGSRMGAGQQHGGLKHAAVETLLLLNICLPSAFHKDTN